MESEENSSSESAHSNESNNDTSEIEPPVNCDQSVVNSDCEQTQEMNETEQHPTEAFQYDFDIEGLNLDKIGVYLFSDGSEYAGEISAEGKPDGIGVTRFKHGGCYTGRYKNGIQDGHGCLIFASGAMYTGQFTDGDRHGYGIYTSPDGFLYRGQWVRSCRQGDGELIKVDGTFDIGHFESDVFGCLSKRPSEAVFCSSKASSISTSCRKRARQLEIIAKIQQLNKIGDEKVFEISRVEELDRERRENYLNTEATFKQENLKLKERTYEYQYAEALNTIHKRKLQNKIVKMREEIAHMSKWWDTAAEKKEELDRIKNLVEVLEGRKKKLHENMTLNKMDLFSK